MVEGGSGRQRGVRERDGGSELNFYSPELPSFLQGALSHTPEFTSPEVSQDPVLVDILGVFIR